MSNKVWFITGASRRFGRELARDGLERGDFVVATARKPQAVWCERRGPGYGFTGGRTVWILDARCGPL